MRRFFIAALLLFALALAASFMPGVIGVAGTSQTLCMIQSFIL